MIFLYLSEVHKRKTDFILEFMHVNDDGNMFGIRELMQNSKKLRFVD
jgi:hypothetical protein